MWILILAITYGSATMGPSEFPTESACISAGQAKNYLGKRVQFVCREAQ